MSELPWINDRLLLHVLIKAQLKEFLSAVSCIGKRKLIETRQTGKVIRDKDRCVLSVRVAQQSLVIKQQTVSHWKCANRVLAKAFDVKEKNKSMCDRRCNCNVNAFDVQEKRDWKHSLKLLAASTLQIKLLRVRYTFSCSLKEISSENPFDSNGKKLIRRKFFEKCS